MKPLWVFWWYVKKMSTRNRLAAWAGLYRRYRDEFEHFWAFRKTLVMPSLYAEEAEFLPAALSLQNRPVSPVGRWVARTMMVIVVVLFVWSVVGKLDISVNATGKIIQSDRTKAIASVEVARVSALYVSEGQTVKAGDVLIELDTRSSDSDRDRAQGDHTIAVLQAQRSRALIDAIDRNQVPQLAAVSGGNTSAWQDAQRHLAGQWGDFSAKLQRTDGEILHYSQALPLVVKRARDYAELAKTGDVPLHAASEKKQAEIDLEAQLRDARNQRATLVSETRKVAQDALNEASRSMSQTAQDALRASVHSELLKLVAPVDGTVQQLTVHTVGGAVPAAQPLMQIVPRQSAVEIEAFIENKDIGFVQEGQRAEVKIEAFEYSKYGTVPARVTHVSRDAIQDEKRGLIYAVKVLLDRSVMQVDGREVNLSAGMSTTVEIKTGTRRVIEYVLSPLVQHSKESLRER